MEFLDPYEVLARRHDYADSQRYHRVLEALMTPLQARIVAELPALPEEVARHLNLDIRTLESELDFLFCQGIISPRDIPGRRGWRFWNDLGSLWSYTVALAARKGTDHALLAAWGEFVEQEWLPRLAQEYSHNPQPFHRVVPAYRAVADPRQLLPGEDLRELFRAQELIAFHPCTCRVLAHRCSRSLDNCFVLGWAAEYALARDAATRVSYQEALALLDRAAQEGSVHMWMNSTFVGARYQCNCCRCCCILIQPPVRYGIPLEKRLAKSRFGAWLISPEKCYSCPTRPCLEPCQFEAIAPLAGEGGRGVAVDPEKCFGCGFCVLQCPYQALELRLVRPPEHIPGLASTI